MKGMYGLKQAGLLANQLLQTRLAPFGYYPRATRLASGCTKRGPSLSPSLKTNSPSNMWERNTLIIS
jgi:hypothetical protein